MKKSFFLVEVLISIMLISGVILALLEIKNNNLNFLEKYSVHNGINSAVSLMALNNKEIGNTNKNFYFNDVVDFKDEDARKKFKDLQLKVKDKQFEDKSFLLEGITIKIETFESKYTVDKNISKNIYTIKFN